jgi:hypothetical protein
MNSYGGGNIELLNGTYNVGAKNITGDYNVSGSGESTTILPSPQISNHYWNIASSTVVFQRLSIRHRWNVTFTDYYSATFASGLFLLDQYGDLTLDTVVVNTLTSALLTSCMVFYGNSSEAIVNIINCTFRDIGFTRVPLMYSYSTTQFTVINSTFRNIISLFLILVLLN